MTEKGEEMGGGGGGGKERESFGIRIHAKKMEKKKKKTCFGSDLGKGRRLPIPNIPGDEWENRSTRGKTTTTLVGCSANPMILILMTVSLSSKLGKTTTKTVTTTTERGGERENSELHYTRIKILGSCLSLQSVLLIYMPIGYT